MKLKRRTELQYGLGVHQWDLPIEDVIRMRRVSVVFSGSSLISPLLTSICAPSYPM